MNSLKRWVGSSPRFARRATWAALAILFFLLSSPALAAPRKKVVEEAETKNYTVPYLIVVILIGVGLMAICRPSHRADKPDEKVKPDEEK